MTQAEVFSIAVQNASKKQSKIISKTYLTKNLFRFLLHKKISDF